MGVWSEGEARQRAEETLRRKAEAQRARDLDEARRPAAYPNDNVDGTAGGGPRSDEPAQTLFDVGFEQERQRNTPERYGKTDGANQGKDSGAPRSSRTPNGLDRSSALTALSNVRSVRGQARQEFGKIYGALNPYYSNIVKSRNYRDLMIFRSFQEPEQQAQILSELRIFSRGDTALGSQHREKELKSVTDVFEQAALREFQHAHERRDYDRGMRRYAAVLETLNGGVSAMQLSIQNHRLVTGREKLGDPMDCIGEHFSGGFSLGPSHAFFSRLAEVLNEDSNIVDRVFSPSVDVMVPLVTRVAEQIISPYVILLLDEVHRKDKQTYLRAASGSLEQSLRLIASLEPPKSASESFQEEAGKIILSCFEAHVDLYLWEETDHFKEQCRLEVSTWEKQLSEQEASAESFFMSNVNRQAVKRDFLTSFKNVIMMPVNVFPSFSSAKAVDPIAYGEAPARTSRPQTPALGERRSSTPTKSEAPTTELAAKAAIMNSKLEGIRSLFSIEVALSLIHKAKTSLERAALFAKLGGQHGQAAKEQCEQVFVFLLQVLGQRHVRIGFDRAVSHMSEYNPREAGKHNMPDVEPLVTFLELVNVGDLIQQMVDVFFLQELVTTKLTDKDDFLNPAVKEKKRFEQMLDERVAAGLSKGIDVLMDQVEYELATSDIRSSGPDMLGPSKTAKKVVDVVSSHTSMLVGSTDKNTLDVFNQECGVRLFAALCKTLKRQRIDTDGAIQLIRWALLRPQIFQSYGELSGFVSDMNHYYDYISTLRNKELLQYFKALRELSQIYLVDSKHAKELAAIITADRYYGIFRAEEVYEFAERRADWYQIRNDVERAMYGVGCTIM